MVRQLETMTQQARSARIRDPVYVGAQATELKWMRGNNILIHLCLVLPVPQCVGMQKNSEFHTQRVKPGLGP